MSNYTEKGSFIVWDHESPLYSNRYERYFDNLNEIYEYFDDPWEVGNESKEDFDAVRQDNKQLCELLELYICTPRYFPELEIPEFLYDELPENYDGIYDAIPQDHPIIQKINELNKFIYEESYILWYEESRIKPIPESLDPNYKIETKFQPRRRRHMLDD